MLVFISYNTSDLKMAQAVEVALAARHPDFEWYLAPRNVAGGAYWIPRLAETIARSDVVLFLAGRQIGNWQELEYYEAFRLARERGGRPRLVPIVTAGQAPGLPFFDQLHQLFAADPAAPETLEALDQALDDSLPPDTSPAWQRFQPYKGLPALEEADAAFFFGRDSETAAILDLMAQRPDRIVALIGQSGVGKSSLARAGVLARLKSQLWPQQSSTWPAGLRNSRTFLPLVVRPGEQPLKELARAFAQLYATRTFELDEETAGWARRFADGAGLRDLLRATRDKLAEAADGEPPKRFVVYVDQGEELYTRANPDESRRFSELVAEATGYEAFSVLLSLRSDYYPAFQDDRAVFDTSEHVDVLRPTRDMVGEVIRRPASTLGARFESGDMAERVADATEREPGALPLLSDLMHEIWLNMQARGDGVLRWSDSPGIVDVAAPLRRRAEAFLADPATDETIVRRLFTLRLAYVPETGDPVRRRARRGECSAAEWAAAETLADQQWRLLTLARAADGEPVVEVAHEQLLRRWPLLKDWLDDERDFLVWKGQVEHDAAAYAALPEAERDGALLLGRPLEIARGWFERRAADLAPDARDFVAASLTADTVRRDAEQRRQRRALFATSTGLILALALAGLAGWQWTRAEAQRHEAETQRVVAETQKHEADGQRAAAEVQTKEARAQRERAERSLTLATKTANGLIDDLATRFTDFGLPASVIQNIINRALELQDQLAAGGGSTPELRRSQAGALIETSMSLGRVGDIDGALSAAQQARDISEALLAANPDNTDYRHLLGTSMEKVGDAELDHGNYVNALAAFRACLAIRKALVESKSDNDNWQRDLSISYERVGEVLRRQYDLAGALAALHEDLAIAKALAAKDPSNVQWQFDLSETDNKLGDALIEQNEFAGALAAYSDGLDKRKALIEKDSNNLLWQRGLFQSYSRLGDVLSELQEFERALTAYHSGHEVMGVLIKKDPGNSDWQHDLALVDENTGDVLKAQGNLAGALVAYRDSLAIVKMLQEKDPSNGGWGRDLARDQAKICRVLNAQGDLAGAIALCRDSVAIAKALVAKYPSNNAWQMDLASRDEEIADVLKNAGRHEEALAAYRDNLAIWKELTQRDPANTNWQRWLAYSLYSVAKSGGEKANLAEALAIAKRLDAAGSWPANEKDWIASFETELAKALPSRVPAAPTSAPAASAAKALERGDQAYERKDYSEAVRWYRNAAEQGNAQAQGNIGRLYLMGQGVLKDSAEAMRWSRKAADQGNPRGETVIGVLFNDGSGVTRDYAEAMRWFRKAAEQEYAPAQTNIGNLYANGQGVMQDYAEAMRWYRKAADNGNPDAQNAIGMLCFNGWGVTQDYAEAMRWYRTAADHGSADAQNSIALLYQNGLGVTQDYAEAMQWYRKAADQGSADAQTSVGLLYENGLGVTQDYAEAMRWYRKAADQEHTSGQNNVGALYDNGLGVPQDHAEAMRWFRKAADKGNATAQTNIGVLYENGRGVVQDYAVAMLWYRKAANQGNATAQNNMGTLYENGQGVTQDYAEAMGWYRKAADQGDATAQTNTGLLFENGWGVAKDYTEAMRWYRKAADQGYARAHYEIGHLYESGYGVPLDMGQATEWMQKAATAGNANAKQWLASH